jgi:nucleoside-diphosphate-sugar epimerase
MIKTALVLGAGGFIGSHMVTELKRRGNWVVGADLKQPEFGVSDADVFIQSDLSLLKEAEFAFDIKTPNKKPFDIVIQLAADMGGAEYIFTGKHDADVMSNSAAINLNVAKCAVKYKVDKLFFSSSACIYPQQIQEDANVAALREVFAYPANPDSEYGWEKIFSERMYLAYARNYGLNVRIGRFHNIFGENSTYEGIKAKAPAALCRKVAEAKDGDCIEILGDGKQTRSFLYIGEAVYGVLSLLDSDFAYPINIGSSECVSINKLARMIIKISGKNIGIRSVESSALGVRGRNSNNELCETVLGWRPVLPLSYGIEKLYHWVNKQVNE